ncbi:MAG: TonB-dependent receptor, partial [Novosphingobium sp.]
MFKHRQLISGSVAAMALALASNAFAQEAQPPAEPEGLGEIIVTAQKRSENVQNVPIAIAAFGGEAIKERGISDISALGNITPSVVLDAGTPFAGSGAALGASIRGIGQNDFAINVDPGV